ncbi:acid protease [Trametes punicea]|nr:acid protease [Trametes punicea]
MPEVHTCAEDAPSPGPAGLLDIHLRRLSSPSDSLDFFLADMSRGFSNSFLSLLLLLLTLSVTTSAKPVVQVHENLVRLPLAKRVNLTGSGKLVERDRLRVRNLRARANSKLTGVSFVTDADSNAAADNQAFDYVVNVNIGTPPTTYSLLVDTGSSNTWVGAGRPYVPTSSSKETRNSVVVSYGSGNFSGIEFADTVSLGDGLTVYGQGIGVALSSQGLEGVDGIIGVGPTDLTLNTLFPDTTSTIPTITDNLFTQGVISEHLVSISFEPTDSPEIVNGELTFGGIDSSKFTGSITFACVTLAQHALDRYKSATGAVFDDTTGLLRITQEQFANLQSLFFTISGTTFEFTANAQIWPRALNTAIGGDANSVYLIIGDLGTNSGEGLDFINGQVWLERFYAVFDSGNSRVGFATTPFTTATTN